MVAFACAASPSGRSLGLARIASASGPYVRNPARETPRDDRLQATLRREITTAQHRFAGRSRDATSALAGLSFGLPVAVAVCAALALIGLHVGLVWYHSYLVARGEPPSSSYGVATSASAPGGRSMVVRRIPSGLNTRDGATLGDFVPIGFATGPA